MPVPDSGLTLVQLQALLQQIVFQLANPESVRFPDGRQITQRPVGDLLKALGELEDMILTFGGTRQSKSTLGQTRRGDGPAGPGGSLPGINGYW